MVEGLRFEAQGGLVIPAERLGRMAGIDPVGLRLVELGDDRLIGAEPLPGARARPLLYGDLRLFSVPELLALISSMQKDGRLRLLLPHAEKSISFAAGEIIQASSSVPDDRLGEVMWRRGRLGLEALTRIQALVAPGRRFGALLVEQGLLSARELYDCLKEQVVDIVQGAFTIQRGEFVFFEGPAAGRNAVRLEVSTRELIREGLKVLQEWSRLAEQFPDKQAVAVARPALVEATLNVHERHLLGLVDGARTVEQLVAASQLGEVEALRAMARLQAQSLVELRAQTRQERSEAGDLGQVLEAQARLLRRIHQTLLAFAPGAVERLGLYLHSPPARHRPVFERVTFDGDGRLDLEALAQNARRLEPTAAREAALDALRDLYDYALFQAMDVLADEECDALVEKLDAMRASLDQAREEVP
jgi:hypothetical protein